jgi:hypothetical protein
VIALGKTGQIVKFKFVAVLDNGGHFCQVSHYFSQNEDTITAFRQADVMEWKLFHDVRESY